MTKKQQEILRFIKAFIEKHNFSPSYREIGAHFGLKSLSTVHKHVAKLLEKGQLSGDKGASRSLIIPQKEESLYAIPIVGHFTLGKGISMTNGAQTTIEMPPSMVPNPQCTYLLIAAGSGLSSLLLSEGDLLLVEASDLLQEGDTALLKGGILTNEPPPGAPILAVLLATIRVHRDLAQNRQASLTSAPQ